MSCATKVNKKIGTVYLTTLSKDTLYSQDLEYWNQKISFNARTKQNDDVLILTFSMLSGTNSIVVPFQKGQINNYQYQVDPRKIGVEPISKRYITVGGNRYLNDYEKMYENVSMVDDTILVVNKIITNLYTFYLKYKNSGMVGSHVYDIVTSNKSDQFTKFILPENKKKWEVLLNRSNDNFSREMQRIRAAGLKSNCKSHSLDTLVLQSDNSVIHPDLLTDHIKVVVFWATWCAPCKTQMKTLSELNNSNYSDKKVVFIATSSESDGDVVFQWYEKNRKKYDGLAFVHDNKYCMAENYKISRLPTIMIFDKQNHLIKNNCSVIEVQGIVDSLLNCR